MTWFFIILSAIILLLLFIPINLDVFYNGEFCVRVGVLFFKFVIPFDKLPQKPKKPKAAVKTKGDSFSKKLSDLFSLIKTVKSIVLRSISISLFRANIVVCADDPCDTALLYGGINALCYAIRDLFLSFTKIKKTDINITADYNGEKTEVLFNIIIKTYVFKFLVSLVKTIADGAINSNDK